MNNPTIQSITISIPSDMIYYSRSCLSKLFRANQWGDYFKYGNTSLLLINLNNFTPFGSIFDKVAQFIFFLKSNNIMSLFFPFDKINIFEIKLQFDILIPGCIFCKTGYFNKVAEDTYMSGDYWQNKGINKDKPSKGRQYSFLTVTQYENIGSSVLFTFSGRYVKHIPFNFITLNYNEMIDHLCSLASVYLTHATAPNGFVISRGYFPFVNKHFQKVLNDANWFSPNFSKKYYKPNILRGALL